MEFHCIVMVSELFRGHKDKIFGLAFNPKDPLKLTSVGVRHIKFWNHAGIWCCTVKKIS